MFGTSPETLSPAQCTKCGPDNTNLTKSLSLADFFKSRCLAGLGRCQLMSVEGRLTKASAQRPAEPVKRHLASHARLKLNTRTEAVKNSHKRVNGESLELNRFVCAKGRPRRYGLLCSLIRSRTTARGSALRSNRPIRKLARCKAGQGLRPHLLRLWRSEEPRCGTMCLQPSLTMAW